MYSDFANIQEIFREEIIIIFLNRLRRETFYSLETQWRNNEAGGPLDSLADGAQAGGPGGASYPRPQEAKFFNFQTQKG